MDEVVCAWSAFPQSRHGHVCQFAWQSSRIQKGLGIGFRESEHTGI